MIAVVVMLAALVCVQAGALVVFARSLLVEQKRLVNLLVAQTPRDFAVLERATNPPEPAPETYHGPSLIPDLQPGQSVVGLT